MLTLYKAVMRFGAPALKALLKQRARKGKEDPARLGERMGMPSRPRPEGRFFWVHAASMGESQSALILLDRLKKAAHHDISIMVTTGTLTSARLMAERLEPPAFHQFYPLDHPDWVRAFLDHWQPDAVFWMESELWPSMLGEIRARGIPAALVNGRLSPSSFGRWQKARGSAEELMASFSLCLVQTEQDRQYFTALGASHVIVTDNLKFSASPLPANAQSLTDLKTAIGKRPCWLYASTHAGEEELACRIHVRLKKTVPDLLTVIVPRHPHRGKDAQDICLDAILDVRRRSEGLALPRREDDIYIADTLGELGLFYRLCPVACIGRSFSLDGGGGHNPIEPALLNCAVLHGPHVQNLAAIYREMDDCGAALNVSDENALAAALERFLADPEALRAAQARALTFAQAKARVIDTVMDALAPVMAQAGSNGEPRKCA